MTDGSELRTSAISAATVADLRAQRPLVPGDGLTRAFGPVTLPGGDGTIQLEPVSVGSFTVGARDDGGMHYVSATYRVRNARADSTPYPSARQNLTFLAVATGSTLNATAVVKLGSFDGSPAPAAIASSILPTGSVRHDPATGEMGPAASDVLQVFLEAEAQAIDLSDHPDVTTVFPYGFVVRNPSDPTSRALAANPASNDFDGLVTFAFAVPLQPTAAQDPFTLSVMFLAVDDDEVRITQSLEEQTPEGQAAFEARAASLGATLITLLPGSGYTGTPSRMICRVRAAGTAAAPSAYLVDACPAGTRTWAGAFDASWSNPGNWQLAGVPAATDTVVVPAAAVGPTLDTDAEIAALRIQGGRLVIEGHVLTITN